MASLGITVDQIINLIEQLPLEGKQTIFDRLQQEIVTEHALKPLDDDSRVWLESDVAGDSPDYDWGTEGIPEGKPIEIIPGQGAFVVEEDRLEA